MDIINLIGGLLYQWDTGRKVKIASPSCINVDEVHFTNDMQDALVVEPKSADNVYYAEIPNILLQDKRRIKVYVVTRTETGEQTVCCRGLTVNPRQKPADYIYTETELKRWESLDERIKALEEGGVGGSADAVLYTEQELTEEQKAVARENIGAVGAPQTAEVGQVISVKAVDDEGKPTEWECVDMESGEEWVTILNHTQSADDVTNELKNFWADKDLDGNPFSCDKMLVLLRGKAGGSNTVNVDVKPNNNGCNLFSNADATVTPSLFVFEHFGNKIPLIGGYNKLTVGGNVVNWTPNNAVTRIGHRLAVDYYQTNENYHNIVIAFSNVPDEGFRIVVVGRAVK